MLYIDISSSVFVNGHLSEAFSVMRIVRQGCGLYPLVYVLFIFALKIKAHPDITGIGLLGTEEESEISQFADDN